ncbi:unnamed protein product [Prunus armeniaca]
MARHEAGYQHGRARLEEVRGGPSQNCRGWEATPRCGLACGGECCQDNRAMLQAGGGRKGGSGCQRGQGEGRGGEGGRASVLGDGAGGGQETGRS